MAIFFMCVQANLWLIFFFFLADEQVTLYCSSYFCFLDWFSQSTSLIPLILSSASPLITHRRCPFHWNWYSNYTYKPGKTDDDDDEKNVFHHSRLHYYHHINKIKISELLQFLKEYLKPQPRELISFDLSCRPGVNSSTHEKTFLWVSNIPTNRVLSDWFTSNTDNELNIWNTKIVIFSRLYQTIFFNFRLIS